MKVAILQSSYLPWIGFFALVDKVDRFVFYDDTQFTIRDWRTRNRIRVKQGWTWLSVPVVKHRSYFEYEICEMAISYDHDWVKRHIALIRTAYNKAPYFSEIFPIIEKIFYQRKELLIDLNYEIIFELCDYLGMNREKFLFAQNMHISKDLRKTDRLIAVLDRIDGVKEYFAGIAGKNYLEEYKFIEKGIRVIWHEYEPPFYNQILWGSNYFISYLSIIDLIFNHGKKSLDIIRGKIKKDLPKEIKIITPDEYRRSFKGIE